MFNSKFHALFFLISITLLTSCSINLSKTSLAGYDQNYKLGEQITVTVGSAMLSRINYKNSCYDYIALIDYETPGAAALGPATIKKGDQHPACFQNQSDENNVFIQSIHAYSNIFLGIDKSGFIGDKGGWYNSNGGIKMFQHSWTHEQLFALSGSKYYPGFDSRRERLVYLGVNDGKIRIGYRLENHNSSKPDESNDIIHDLKDGDTISYQNFTLKILNADSTKITFLVINDNRDK